MNDFVTLDPASPKAARVIALKLVGFVPFLLIGSAAAQAPFVLPPSTQTPAVIAGPNSNWMVSTPTGIQTFLSTVEQSMMQAAFKYARAISVSGIYNVLKYGSIADGTSHPASTVYSSLAALQVDHPLATAVTNEMDWIALNDAWAACKASGKGGVVYNPTGNYILDNSNSLADGSGTITGLEATDYDGVKTCHLIGDGVGATVFHLPTDLGTGKCFYNDANRLTTGAGNWGIISGIEFIGAGSPVPTLGVAPANMDGGCTGSNKSLFNTRWAGFHTGVDYVGGQMAWINNTFDNNFYNMRVSHNSGGLFGDFHNYRPVRKNATMADYAVAQDADINDTTEYGGYDGTAPHGIWKETNNGNPADIYIANGYFTDNHKYENIGNSAITTDNGTTSGFIVHLRMPDLFFDWNANTGAGGWRLSSKPQLGVLAFNTCSDCEIQPRNPAAWTPGTAGVLAISNPQGVTLRGDIGALITATESGATGSKYLFTGGNQSQIVIQNTNGSNAWNGRIAYGTPGTTVSKGMDVVKAPNINYAGQPLMLSPSAGTASEIAAGVIMHCDGETSDTGKNCLVATSGVVPVNASGTFSAATGSGVNNAGTAVYLRTGPGGTVTPSSGFAQTTSPNVGSEAIIPTTTTPTSVIVDLHLQ